MSYLESGDTVTAESLSTNFSIALLSITCCDCSAGYIPSNNYALILQSIYNNFIKIPAKTIGWAGLNPENGSTILDFKCKVSPIKASLLDRILQLIRPTCPPTL